MEIEKSDYDLTVCRIKSEKDIDLNKEFYFIGKTDEEYSLVCITDDIPDNTIQREDGIFAVSTFNADYIPERKKTLIKH